MDCAQLELRLANAELRVRLSFEVIAEQRQRVAALEAWGHDGAATARQTLQQFEEMQEGFSTIWNRPSSS